MSNLKLEIINNHVHYKETNEKICIDKLNTGLSKFYGNKVSINKDNLPEFEGDILALSFGFNK